MVFGTFDSLHDGHRHFLREAKNHGDYLIAVVASDHTVRHLKGKHPEKDISIRMEELKEEESVDEIVMGDEDLDTWEVVKRYRPEVIALGHDQHALRSALEAHFQNVRYHSEIVTIGAHKRSNRE